MKALDFIKGTCQYDSNVNCNNWRFIESKKPLAYKSGDWDGLYSDDILVRTKDGKHHVVQMVEGVLAGSSFCNFYNNDGYEVTDIVCWLPIPE